MNNKIFSILAMNENTKIKEEYSIKQLNPIYANNHAGSFMIEAYDFITSLNEEALLNKQNLYKAITESVGNEIIIHEGFAEFFEGIKKIIDKFLAFIKSLFEKFLIFINRAFNEDKYLKNSKNELKKFSSEYKFEIQGFKYTFNPNIPTNTAEEKFHLENPITLLPEVTPSNITNSDKAEEMKTKLTEGLEKIKNIKAELDDGTWADVFRGNVLNMKDITDSNFSDELFKIFRDGQSVLDTIEVTSSIVDTAFNYFSDYKKMKTTTDKELKKIETDYKNLRKSLESMSKSKNISNITQIDLIFSGASTSGVYNDNDMAALKNGNKDLVDMYMLVLSNIAEVQSLKVQTMSNIHTMAYAAKLDAMKDAYVQSKNICYKALYKMKGKKNVNEDVNIFINDGKGHGDKHDKPMMEDETNETYAFKCEKGKCVIKIFEGNDIVSTLKDILAKKGITYAKLSGVGATNDATIRYYNNDTGEDEEEVYTGNFEIASMAGSIGVHGSDELHLHIVIGDKANTYAGDCSRLMATRPAEIVIELLSCEQPPLPPASPEVLNDTEETIDTEVDDTEYTTYADDAEVESDEDIEVPLTTDDVVDDELEEELEDEEDDDILEEVTKYLTTPSKLVGIKSSSNNNLGRHILESTFMNKLSKMNEEQIQREKYIIEYNIEYINNNQSDTDLSGMIESYNLYIDCMNETIHKKSIHEDIDYSVEMAKGIAEMKNMLMTSNHTRYIAECLLFASDTPSKTIMEELLYLEADGADDDKNAFQKFTSWLKKIWAKFTNSIEYFVTSNLKYLKKYENVITKQPLALDITMKPYTDGITNMINTHIPLFNEGLMNEGKLENEDTFAASILGKLYDDKVEISDNARTAFTGGDDEVEMEAKDINMTDIYNYCIEYKTGKVKKAIDSDYNNITKSADVATKIIDTRVKAIEDEAKKATADGVTPDSAVVNQNTRANRDALNDELEKEKQSSPPTEKQEAHFIYSAYKGKPISELQISGGTQAASPSTSGGDTVAKNLNARSDESMKKGSLDGKADPEALKKLRGTIDTYNTVAGKIITAKTNAASEIYKNYMKIIQAHVKDKLTKGDGKEGVRQSGTKYTKDEKGNQPPPQQGENNQQ